MRAESAHRCNHDEGAETEGRYMRQVQWRMSRALFGKGPDVMNRVGRITFGGATPQNTTPASCDLIGPLKAARSGSVSWPVRGRRVFPTSNVGSAHGSEWKNLP